MRINARRSDAGAALMLVLVFGMLVSVWLAATLFMVQTSSAENARARNQNEKQYAAMLATMQSISTIANSATAGLDINASTNPCGLAQSDYLVGSTLVSIECNPLKDSGVVVPLDGIMLMGASGVTGGIPGIDYGLNLQMPSVNNCSLTAGCAPLNIENGNIRSLSNPSTWTIKSGGSYSSTDPSGVSGASTAYTYVNVGGLVRIRSTDACVQLKNAGTGSNPSSAPPATCVVDAGVDPRLSTSSTYDYWKALKKAVRTSTITSYFNGGGAVAVPSPNCNSTPQMVDGNPYVTVTLQPGHYEGPDLIDLNALTAAEGSAGPCQSSANGKPLQVKLSTGVYLFDFDVNPHAAETVCKSATTWCINTTSTIVTSDGFNGFSATGSAYCGASGVQIVLAKSSRIQVNGGKLGLCSLASPAAGEPTVGVVALDATTTTELGLSSSTVPGNAGSASNADWAWTTSDAQLFPSPFKQEVSGVKVSCLSTTGSTVKTCDFVFTVPSAPVKDILPNYAVAFQAKKNGANPYDFCFVAESTRLRANQTSSVPISCTNQGGTGASVTTGLVPIGSSNADVVSSPVYSAVNKTISVTVKYRNTVNVDWDGLGTKTFTAPTSGELFLYLYGYTDSFPQSGCANYRIPASQYFAQMSAVCLAGTAGSSVFAVLDGTVFAPSAPLSVAVDANGGSFANAYFGGGLIGKAFWMQATGVNNAIGNQPLRLKPPKNTNGNRLVRVTASIGGNKVTSVVANIRENYGQAKGNSIQLNSTASGCNSKNVCTS